MSNMTIVVIMVILTGIIGSSISMCASNDVIGINYGMLADNLPPPNVAMKLIKSIGITKAKIYTVNSSVLQAFANSGISFMVGIDNSELKDLTNAQNAQTWVQNNIEPFLSSTPISTIAVGNEALTSNDETLIEALVPAMINIKSALLKLPSSAHSIIVSTPHSLGILYTSYPPSHAQFKSSLISSSLKSLLTFLSQTNAPFMINAYPYFSYKSNSQTISLQYALFQPNEGVKDDQSGLTYYNLLDSQVDAIYYAMQALNFKNIPIVIAETGWPSAGDPDEPAANRKNAQAYNSNLIKHLNARKGTPLRPNIPIQAYIFSLFNEDSKPGPTSERNFGLFEPNGMKVYDLDVVVTNPVVVTPCTTCSNHTHTHVTSMSSKLNVDVNYLYSIWMILLSTIMTLM